MIDITFTITKKEYIEAQRLFIQKKRRKRRTINLILIGVSALGVGIVVIRGSEGVSFRIAFILGCSVLIAAIFFLGNLLQRYVLGRRFRTESRFLTNAHMQLDADAFRSEIAEMGKGTTNWTAFNDWIEGPSVFLIIAGYTFRPVPKRCLSADQQDELRSLLTTKIART